MLAGEIRQEGRKVRHLLRLDALGDQGRGLPRQTDGVAHIAGHMVEVVGHRFEAFIENHAHVFTLPVAARALCTQSL